MKPLLFRYTRRRLLAWLGSALALSSVVQNSKAAGWEEGFELVVQFTLDRPTSGRIAKPYTAVWVENTKGDSLRTLALWIQTGGRGNSYISSLKQWYQAERYRKADFGGNLIETASTPTRPAGQYTVVWNGRNDSNQLVSQGEYMIVLESSREHGPYGLVFKRLEFGNTPFRIQLGDSGDIKDVSLIYRKRP